MAYLPSAEGAFLTRIEASSHECVPNIALHLRRVLRRYYCEGELADLIQPRNPPLNRLYFAYTARNIRMPRNRAVRDTLLKAKAQW